MNKMTMSHQFLFQKLIILAGLIYCTLAQYYNGTNEVTLDASNGFSVQYFDTYKVLTNLITNETYALVCCNQSLINFTTIGGYQAAVNTPLDTVGISTELESLPFFELLNLTDKVKSASPIANVTSPCFGDISDMSAENGTTVDILLTASQTTTPTIGYGTQYITVSTNNMNLTPLQQSAWIVYVAHFFEQEVYANSILSTINNLYTCHKDNLASAGSQNIAWTTYDVVANAWTLHFDPYTSTLIQDAGMRLANNQSTTYTNTADFQNALSTVDFIIDDTPAANFKTGFDYSDWLNAAGLNLSSTANYVANKNVYRTDNLVNANGYSDYPIRHSARADLVLSDVIHMVYSTYEPSYNMTWLRTFARLNNPTFISNASYPSCTNPFTSLILDICTLSPFSPNNNSSVTIPIPSTNPSISKGLSVGAKIGVVIGVCAGVTALAVVGVFVYKRRRVSRTEGTFVKMNDL